MSSDLVLELLIRGFLQVAPVAANTVFISRGQYIHAALGAWLISVVWWLNAGTAGMFTSWPAAFVYGCGASCGVLCGMRVARWIGGRSAGPAQRTRR